MTKTTDSLNVRPLAVELSTGELPYDCKVIAEPSDVAVQLGRF